MISYMNDLVTPKTEPKSEPIPYFPRIFSRNSQIRPRRDVLSVSSKLRPSFKILEKRNDIKKNNEILLNKMLKIDLSPSSFSLKDDKIIKPTSNSIFMEKQLKKVRSENNYIQLKLKNVKATYNFQKVQKSCGKKGKGLNKSEAPNKGRRSYYRNMRVVEKMIKEELDRREEYKSLLSNN